MALLRQPFVDAGVLLAMRRRVILYGEPLLKYTLNGV
jgi:hypothetical protein